MVIKMRVRMVSKTRMMVLKMRMMRMTSRMTIRRMLSLLLTGRK